LRRGSPPVVARVEGERVLLDLRTVPAERDGEIATALEAAG
jgi:L-seryl-tRNA(Ser) seleniumtransferase